MLALPKGEKNENEIEKYLKKQCLKINKSGEKYTHESKSLIKSREELRKSVIGTAYLTSRQKQQRPEIKGITYLNAESKKKNQPIILYPM